MICTHCNLEIHPVNLTYIDSKPYHYLCVELVNQTSQDKDSTNVKVLPLRTIVVRYVILGAIIYLGILAVHYVFGFGVWLGQLLRSSF